MSNEDRPRLCYPDSPSLAACDIKLQTLKIISRFHFHPLFGNCADSTHHMTCCGHNHCGCVSLLPLPKPSPRSLISFCPFLPPSSVLSFILSFFVSFLVQYCVVCVPSLPLLCPFFFFFFKYFETSGVLSISVWRTVFFSPLCSYILGHPVLSLLGQSKEMDAVAWRRYETCESRRNRDLWFTD